METKTCCKCAKELPASAFNKKKARLSSYCKECNKAYQRLHYEGNKGKYIEQNRTRIQAVKQRFRDYKAERGCSRCEEKHPACLQFHHIDASTKIDDVSVLINEGRSIESILLEIKKCIILCANCHFKEHDMAH